MDKQCKGTAAKTTYREEIFQNDARSAEIYRTGQLRGLYWRKYKQSAGKYKEEGQQTQTKVSGETDTRIST